MSPLQRRTLLGNERKVMLHVSDSLEYQLPQGDEAGFAVNSDTLPDLSRLQAQDARHVSAQGREQVELFREVERLIVQALGIGSFIDTHQQGALQGNCALD